MTAGSPPNKRIKLARRSAGGLTRGRRSRSLSAVRSTTGRMPELTFSENNGRLVIVSPMPVGTRWLFAAIGLFPLLAPWELLVRPHWSGRLGLFFVFAAVISAGALCLSGLLFFAAVAGLSSRITLDAGSMTFTYSAMAPVVPTQLRSYPLADLAAVDVRTYEWSDGAPSHSLRILTTDGITHETASSWSREEVEDYRHKVAAFLSRHVADRPLS